MVNIISDAVYDAVTMNELDTPGLLNTPSSMERKRSIFELTTRADRLAAAQDVKMAVSCDRPVGQLPQTKISKENTYRLGPDRIFKPAQSRQIAEHVVNHWIQKDSQYTADWARQTAKIITTEVKTHMKKLNYDRYKYVVQVFIGQKSGQGLECSSRFLSDADTDSYTEYSFSNDSLWCVVTIFALYCE